MTRWGDYLVLVISVIVASSCKLLIIYVSLPLPSRLLVSGISISNGDVSKPDFCFISIEWVVSNLESSGDTLSFLMHM